MFYWDQNEKKNRKEINAYSNIFSPSEQINKNI
jgi:hypothetical protein